MIKISRARAWLALALCGFLVAAAMAKAAYVENPRSQKEHLYYFPNARALHAYALGFDHAVADLLWMRTLAYFGGHYQTDQDYRYLANMLDVITQLNPHHASAYYMAAVVLPWMVGALAESHALLLRAMVNFPEDGRWAYYLGVNQFLFASNRKLARHYLVRAVQHGYVNRFSAMLAARLQAETGTLEGARTFVRQLLGNRQDSRMRAYLEAELKNIETEIVLRRVDRQLARLGPPPHHTADLQKLRRMGVALPRTLPDGGRLLIGPDGLSRSSRSPHRYSLHESRRLRQLRMRQ